MGVDTVDIASRVKALRKKNGWRLHDLSEKTGISVATLSKLENGKTKLNFTTVNKLAQGIGVAVTDLTSPGLAHTKDTTMTLGGGGVVFETRDVDYEVLCADYTGGNQGYAKLSVKARTLDPNLPWHRHPGKEFIYVLKGILVLHTEDREQITLKSGDSLLFDSSIGHHYISAGRGETQLLLSLSLQGYSNVIETLREN
ncbi:XRE family transcriptional regulator [Gammaproteobacteria bacterium]|jgi:transcriptional regulator with XRE-family HTH domain|nr:XRE family transcriptional regulator [Gammaproteobacteria bacterium]MCH9855131.1 XRE family transcriptional regulator [Gammaproteobacteria bacterium]MDA8602013.1 XRE family transcriptional regulator [Gammaproteobacteria bacterium]MDA8671648.1 XRE family transcriptional regulator [Gammaproteobacteria bacterium]MDA8927905.1 XRE family transcriptional regulator [Gammaproteobacteria bacterium]